MRILWFQDIFPGYSINSIFEWLRDVLEVVMSLLEPKQLMEHGISDVLNVLVIWWEVGARATQEEVPLVDWDRTTASKDRGGIQESIEKFVLLKETTTYVYEERLGHIVYQDT